MATDLEHADALMEADDFCGAAERYLRLLQTIEEPDRSLSRGWLTCDRYCRVERVRALLQGRPRSATLHCLYVSVLVQAKEGRHAAEAASDALRLFGESPSIQRELRALRLTAMVEGSRVVTPDWQHVRRDVSELWRDYAASRRPAKLHRALVGVLLQIRGGKGAAGVLLEIADEVAETNERLARVLRSHANTLRLLADEGPSPDEEDVSGLAPR
ncbi:MAG: hypothetical protein KTR31_10295 [Myxococcales bacterium]|nr:hypothetical protein [Myxococcales bacterium]